MEVFVVQSNYSSRYVRCFVVEGPLGRVSLTYCSLEGWFGREGAIDKYPELEIGSGWVSHPDVETEWRCAIS